MWGYTSQIVSCLSTKRDCVTNRVDNNGRKSHPGGGSQSRLFLLPPVIPSRHGSCLACLLDLSCVLSRFSDSDRINRFFFFFLLLFPVLRSEHIQEVRRIYVVIGARACGMPSVYLGTRPRLCFLLQIRILNTRVYSVNSSKSWRGMSCAFHTKPLFLPRRHPAQRTPYRILADPSSWRCTGFVCGHKPRTQNTLLLVQLYFVMQQAEE